MGRASDLYRGDRAWRRRRAIADPSTGIGFDAVASGSDASAFGAFAAASDASTLALGRSAVAASAGATWCLRKINFLAGFIKIGRKSGAT